MLSFITRWFKKSDKNEKPEEEAVVKPYEMGDPIPYTMDFTDADKIEVSARDCSRKNIETVGQFFVRPEVIEGIIDLLEELPTEGERQKEITPCQEHTLTAYKGGTPFAQVVFYEGDLKLANGAFIGSNERALKKQKELFDFISVSL